MVDNHTDHKKPEYELQVKNKEKEDKKGAHDYSFFSEKEVSQIRHVMELCESKIQLNAILLDDCDLSEKMRSFLNEFSEVTDKISISTFTKNDNEKLESEISTELYPVMALMDKDGKYARVNFHGVPAGHELESFMLAIYNVAGPGEEISDELLNRVKKLNPMNLKVGVSLSCVICPEFVTACHRISILNDSITAEMVDLQHFSAIRKKFKIMSVPALIINDNDVVFGGKRIEELVSCLEQY